MTSKYSVIVKSWMELPPWLIGHAVSKDIGIHIADTGETFNCECDECRTDRKTFARAELEPKPEAVANLTKKFRIDLPETENS